MTTIYLSLGSNLGNRAFNIYHALRRLGSRIRIDEVSSLYETEPVEVRDQPWFLNLVCRGDTDLTPEALLHVAKTIEREMGRQKGVRFGPRLIDIDILLYGNLVLDLPQLQIPHPRLHERGFVLIPLGELEPHLIHPVLNRDVTQLRKASDSLEEVQPYRFKDS
jgi:2-amino-4-hydroxy-6-hydroxymethyldihydropteridine diphosphokinase